MIKLEKLKSKIVILSAFAAVFTAAAYCLPLRLKYGGASGGPEFGHYETGDAGGDDPRSCEVWFCSLDTPRTLVVSASYKDRYNQWHNQPGYPKTLTNTLTAYVAVGGFTPCDGVLQIQADIREGTITRAVSSWY